MYDLVSVYFSYSFTIYSGAPGGLTKEVALAQAFLNVCLWRKEILAKRMKEEALTPNPIIAASFTAVHQRLVFIGGFTVGSGGNRQAFALSVEQIYERERRLQVEYHAKIDIERRAEEARTNMENLISAFEYRSRIMEENRKRAREQQLMEYEDVRAFKSILSLP